MTRKAASIVASAIFLILAPGFVGGFVPWWISRWRPEQPLFLLRLLGGILLALGITVLLDSVRRFAVQGLGTPAPVFPTRHLVVSGLYRYVRNPMYVAMVSVILGQALLFGHVALLEYGALVGLIFHLFVLLYEEPTLRASFPSEYQPFFAAVPRWIPRGTPWKGLSGSC